MKLTNKDKQAIRQALYHQIENLLMAASDQYSGLDNLNHLDSLSIATYCYKIVGLYPVSWNCANLEKGRPIATHKGIPTS